MKRILIISDNHGFFSNELDGYVQTADEIWHAGDIGSLESLRSYMATKPFKAVFGNIDDLDVRQSFPQKLVFECEGLTVLMTHIGGYPGKYPTKIKQWIQSQGADVFVCGHSHICKVMKDPMLGHWHINPGSYGHHGFHHMRTAIQLTLDNGKIVNMSVIELGKRGIIDKEMTLK